MYRYKLTFHSAFLFILLISLSGCDFSSILGGSTEESKKEKDSRFPSWIIPRQKVRDGGPGKDGIPSIDNPRFDQASDFKKISDDDLVIGVEVEGNYRAYPIYILDHHEIANDRVNSVPLCITYCPLTATGIVWNRKINGSVTEFGVSGLLYKNNLIPYDRNTDSNWSQMLNLAVSGKLAKTKAQMVNSILMNWETWRKTYPNSKVMNRNTGYDRNYDEYPYGNYKEDHDSFLFPVENKDDRLKNKERVHMVKIDSSVVAYPIEAFSGGGITVNNTHLNDEKFVIFGSRSRHIVESYERTLPDGTNLTFEPVNNSFPVVMEDQTGTRWNIFGKAVKGPRKGTQLASTTSYNGFWFAIVDFFPQVEVRIP